VSLASFNDLAVDDRVWCLASVGTPFRVAALDEEQHRVTIVPQTSCGSGARPLELTADEPFGIVVERFVASHSPGQIVQGYFLETSVGASNQGFVSPNPKLAMSFEIQSSTPGFGQVRVKPVVETADGVVPVGPNVPLRLGMTCYRWSLSFGELIVNWTDFLRPG
jgi:hypothetical protein